MTAADYYAARRALIAAASIPSGTLAERAARLQAALFALDARYQPARPLQQAYGPPRATVSAVDLSTPRERTTLRQARGRRR